MLVRLIAHTQFNYDLVDDLITWQPQADQDYAFPPDADMLAEFAGRACYESWDRPNPETATTRGYLKNIIDQQHFSVLEHASVTFYITNVSRTLTHELVRHRHLSFSQRSQRYVDESNCEFVTPEVLDNDCDPTLQLLARRAAGHHAAGKALYREIFSAVRKQGHKKKVARGAARSVLLGNVGTSIVVSGNHRAWRDFLARRCSAAADPEIRGLAYALLTKLRCVAPAIYQDFPDEPHRARLACDTPETDQTGSTETSSSQVQDVRHPGPGDGSVAGGVVLGEGKIN